MVIWQLGVPSVVYGPITTVELCQSATQCSNPYIVIVINSDGGNPIIRQSGISFIVKCCRPGGFVELNQSTECSYP